MNKLFATLIAVAFAAVTVTPAFAADKMEGKEKAAEVKADNKGKGDAKKTDGKKMADEKKSEKAK